jgi:hypothetical protein
MPSGRTQLALAGLLVASVAAAGCGRSSVYDLDDELALDTEGGDPIVDRCDAVDYLFVIDNSASMADNQRKLIDNFGAFVQQVESSLDTVDSLHVGVVTSDAYAYNSSECRGLGGLVTKTGGQGSSGRACGPYAEGHPWMTEADDLLTSFACAAQVGIGGSTYEQPLTAAADAIDGVPSREGQCNDGFVRDDALLVVVVVSDEDEPGAGGRLAEAMTRAKNGYRDNAVLVGIVNVPGETCGLGGHASWATETVDLAESIEHGFVGSICDDDYTATFAAAVDVVREACGQ